MSLHPSHLPLDRTYAAVLFDLDGTLIASIGSVERSWTRLAQEYEIPADRFGDFHGVPARRLLEILMPDRSPGERARALLRIEQIEVEDTAGIEVLPGAREALATAMAVGRGAIVTSGSRRLARARLGASGLPVPDVLVTADDVDAGKPDPTPYLLGAARLGHSAQDCLVVEDATAGVASARAAGATTIALATTSAPGSVAGDLMVADLSAVRLEIAPDGVRVRLR
ncbi:HAD-IA family hydrolase [Cellulomonas sp. KRMCY2]|uniref:HAD-IA family hydrolase n=1 Tax=Cellulomonas sp. KRMCY2 TaxID=1304865 RepID=UPI0004AD6201|nr:HAD-IA family hydrolase [Cellulomonas sp. KRMCY2]